jgi:rhodanese-related sulfurtransferase
VIFPSDVEAPLGGNPVLGPAGRRRPLGVWRWAAALLPAGALLVLSSCLGTGTLRIDASCREMRSAVVYEMLKDNPTMHLIDLRKPSEVTEQEGRILGARAVPLDELDARSGQLQVGHDHTIVVFGNDGETGRLGCKILSARGFEFVIFISDGAIGWFKNGLPSARYPSGGSMTAGEPAPRRSE